MSPHKRSHNADTRDHGGSLRQNLGSGGQATPAAFEAVCTNNYGRDRGEGHFKHVFVTVTWPLPQPEILKTTAASILVSLFPQLAL